MEPMIIKAIDGRDLLNRFRIGGLPNPSIKPQDADPRRTSSSNMRATYPRGAIRRMRPLRRSAPPIKAPIRYLLQISIVIRILFIEFAYYIDNILPIFCSKIAMAFFFFLRNIWYEKSVEVHDYKFLNYLFFITIEKKWL